MSQHWFHGLNQEQVEAVKHDTGPLLILAGAGSGKTTVLVSRTGRLIDEGIVSPEKLCVLTFTNKAARELKTRVAAKVGKAAKGIWAGTFHSFGLRLLRRFHKEAGFTSEFGVLDSGDASSIVKELLRDFNNCGKTAYDGEKLLSLISRFREDGRKAAKNDDEYEVAVEWLLPRYLKRLELLGMVDFDSLILKPIELMEQHPEVCEAIRASYDQVMVDEFQDTNHMQMRLIKMLVSPHRNLAVVGDDDQSIYGWRGAVISNILNFPKLYHGCKVVRLERNYRSTPAILSVANSVISKNNQRHAKVLRARDNVETGQAPELFVYENENEEAENVGSEIGALIREGFAKKHIAVLYRSNSQGALLEAELRRQQIPYLMSGGTAFFDRKETRDILAYLRCAFKPNEVALRRIVNTPARGIGEKTIELLTHYAKTKQISFVEAARAWHSAGVDERAGASLEELFQLLRGFISHLIEGEGTPGQRMMGLFQEMGYKAHVEKIAGNALMATKRWRMVEVFSGILDRFVEKGGRSATVVREFLDAMELRDTLEEKKADEDRVQLLTFHACKGLEFPVVFMMGLEEDIIPHKMLGNDISEERRLFYVGVTRAQKRLIFTRARQRRKHGKLIVSAPSRFLLEIPPELIVENDGPRPAREDQRKAMIADLFKKLDSLGGAG